VPAGRAGERREAAHGSSAPAWLPQALVRLPLFYKLLAVNGLVVGGSAGVGTWATAVLARRSADLPVLLLVAGFVTAGLVASLVLNALVLRWALRPLDVLEDAAAGVKHGEEPTGAGIPVPPAADRDLARLVEAFNGMLETVAAYRSRLRRLAVRALDAAEEERSRLAGELQDDIAQRIASCLLRIQLARRAEGEEREAALEELREEAGGTLEVVRRMARGLRPPELDELGLENAVRALGREFTERRDAALEMEIGPVDQCLGASERLALYRGIQEALNNARRHAAADRVRLRLRMEEDCTVVAEIRDDGRGFDARGALSEDRGSLGLLGIRERALYVGGDATVVSRPGAGTRVRIEVPGRGRPAAPAADGLRVATG
jgi:signal transduction histidine kinase